jgi:hypothetical protein
MILFLGIFLGNCLSPNDMMKNVLKSSKEAKYAHEKS